MWLGGSGSLDSRVLVQTHRPADALGHRQRLSAETVWVTDSSRFLSDLNFRVRMTTL